MPKIPNKIADNEILVRFIYTKNFKNKIPSQKNLIVKDIFLPYKGGVSLQRYRYSDENQCKIFAKNNRNIFSGFILFTKNIFEKVMMVYKEGIRSEFKAEIIHTPLNNDFDYRKDLYNVYTEDLGNPSHSDLIYINPAISGDESTNVAIRSFSRKLAKECKLVLDPESKQTKYSGLDFNQAIKKSI